MLRSSEGQRTKDEGRTKTSRPSASSVVIRPLFAGLLMLGLLVAGSGCRSMGFMTGRDPEPGPRRSMLGWGEREEDREEHFMGSQDEDDQVQRPRGDRRGEFASKRTRSQVQQVSGRRELPPLEGAPRKERDGPTLPSPAPVPSEEKLPAPTPIPMPPPPAIPKANTPQPPAVSHPPGSPGNQGPILPPAPGSPPGTLPPGVDDPHNRVAPTAYGSILNLPPGKSPIEKALELSGKLEGAVAENHLIKERMRSLEEMIQARDRMLNLATRDLQDATAEVARVRRDLQTWADELKRQQGRMQQQDKEHQQLLESVIKMLEKALGPDAVPPLKPKE